jgi:hypothetical protein
MNDNQTLTREEREQLERFRAHQEQFDHRQMIAGFCRWMKSRFAPKTIATAAAPRKAPVSLSAARTSKSRRRSSDASQESC